VKIVQEFEDALKEMRDHGITRGTLRRKHHMTTYGAQKFTDLVADREKEIDGRGKKKFHTSKDPFEHPQEILNETIPTENNHSKELRVTQNQKQKLTNSARNFLEQLEKEVKELETQPIEWSEDVETSEEGIDLVWHETDAHFGALSENEYGEIIYNSDVATDRLHTRLKRFEELASTKHLEQDKEVDTIHFLLGGDWMEGTAIYNGQGHEVDMNINEQFEKVRKEYFKVIKELIDLADSLGAKLQIVSAHGNHGELRGKGASNKANMDDILAHTLHHMTGIHLDGRTMQNEVRFKHSDSTMGITFPIRNHTGYLVHGQNMKEHVGTSSGKKDALATMQRYNADIIFRGHYHMNKVEDVSGVPVVMTGSPKPPGQFEDSISEYGHPASAFYVSTDENVLAGVKYLKY